MLGLDRKKWADARLVVLRRDGYRCTVAEYDPAVRCSTGPLHVHHIDEDGFPYDPENLTTVCAAHHARWHALRRRFARREIAA